MSKPHLALAAIALLVSAVALAMAQNSGFYDQQTAACGYYVNSSGRQVPRPCGTASGATTLCADGRYSYSEPLRTGNLLLPRRCRPTSPLIDLIYPWAARVSEPGLFFHARYQPAEKIPKARKKQARGSFAGC